MIPSNDTWPADVKNSEGRNGVDPNVLPEYTLLPASPPPPPAVSYNNESPEAGNGAGPSDQVHASAATLNVDGDAEAQTPTCGTESLRIVKLLYVGLMALALPPVFLAGMALAMGAVVLYGCGKILEGIGRACAFVPEMVYRGCVRRRAARCWRAVSAGGGARREGAEQEEEGEEECVEEGRVALEDVETGRGGPISI